jgi:cytochrome b561
MKRLLSGYDPKTMLIAKTIHLSMYPVMLAIPLLALGRTYGAGRGFEFFSVPIFRADPTRDIEVLVTLGNAYHGLLGWILFATIFGHIFAVIIHHAKKDPVLRKIT